MKTTLFIILIFLPFLGQSQVTVYTKAGRPILIYGDGTWKYGDPADALQKVPIQSPMIQQETDIDLRLDKFHKDHTLGAGLEIGGAALAILGAATSFTNSEGNYVPNPLLFIGGALSLVGTVIHITSTKPLRKRPIKTDN